MEADVIVVGSGAAGLTASVVAAHAKFSVIVLESTPFFGGTTAYSAGGVWIPANHHMPATGVEDSIPEARAYLQSVLGDLYDGGKVDAFLEQAPKMLKFLEDIGAAQFTGTPIPDYAPGKPGWKTGRCLLAIAFSAQQLGPLAAKLRPPIPEMGLFHSMQVSSFDAYQLAHWKESRQNLLFALKRMGAYFANRLIGRRGQHLANGNALVAQLLNAAASANVELFNNTKAVRLVMTGRRVSGVVIRRNGLEETVIARRGVVLASGGFGANAEMRRRFVPFADAGYSLQPEGCMGEGINMGVDVGGVLNEGNAANGIWVPASSCRRPDGSLAKFPSLAFDRHCPESIMVDAKTGRRFINESFHYQHFGETVQRAGITKAWMISDARAVARYGIGMAKPAPFSPKPWVKRGYLKEAHSIGELSHQIGVPSEALEKTVTDFNQYAQKGKDPDFNRGDDYYSKFMGDAMHTPNPTLGPLMTAPFYAVELRPADLSTLAGLNTNSNAQVIRKDGSPIPGLYAAGLDSNSMMRGLYPGGGSSIGPAMTFGFIAARDIARLPVPVESAA